MPSKRQRKAKAAAAKVAVATTQEEAAKSDIRSPDPKSNEAELQIGQVREDGVRLTVRPVPGATSQWVSWRYAPRDEPWSGWQGQAHDKTGRADTIFVPLKHSDDTCYEFHRGYSKEEGTHQFLGVVELPSRDTKIEERGDIGTGIIGSGVKHTMVEQQRRGGSTGGRTLEQQVQRGTLEEDLGGRIRLPKPRSIGYIDDKVWSGAMEAARGQAKQEYGINGTLDVYYLKMCKPGQLLLAGEIHRRAQLVYDYRACKAIYRDNRKQKK